MGKIKTSDTQKESLKNTRKLKKCVDLEFYRPGDIVLQEGFLSKAIGECLANNDPEGVIEVVRIYLKMLNKKKLIKKSGLKSSTLYKSLKAKNPTLKTLATIVHYAIEATKL